jgi:hypothetical protein
MRVIGTTLLWMGTVVIAGCGTAARVDVQQPRSTGTACSAWCIEDSYSVNCQGQGSETLPDINPDGLTDDPSAENLYGCGTENVEYPICDESAVGVDGIQCNPQCQEDGTCGGGGGFLKHNPGNCYGACGKACGGCCSERTAYCRPGQFWIDRGINAVTNLPNGCALVANLGGGRKRVTCGKSAFDYFNRGKDLADAGMLAAARALRTRQQSTNSLGSCPSRDWAAAAPRSFWNAGAETFTRNPADAVPAGATAYTWVGIGRAAQSCSVHTACYAHDECNRHDKLRYLECTLFGQLALGKPALKGTPTVNFNYGWWKTDGSLRVAGPALQFPEAKTVMPEMSADPKLDCYYDFDPALMTMPVTAPYPVDFATRAHAVEQVPCPIHNVAH